MTRKPEILAPAGDTQSFLAAMAAGADAVYLGLKHFSARMQADNFGSAELSRMVELANENGRRIYVAFNTLVKPDDVPAAGRLIARLARDVKPHGLIIQDPGVLALARQAGYEGGLFLSTLANLTHPASLLAAKELGADRVILPRELSIDEVKQISAACPEGLDLEMFIHGALCWCVSGRCYWSSYMGGKSGLRGRCVQPCRRVYKQRNHSGRFFSCLDLSLDVLAKTITDIPHLSCWKIEGRKTSITSSRPTRCCATTRTIRRPARMRKKSSRWRLAVLPPAPASCRSARPSPPRPTARPARDVSWARYRRTRRAARSSSRISN